MGQILGAEKALFRALKTKGNTPKYGLLFHSTFIGRATAKNKGRISRFLANKCSIASRIDAFSETPNTIFGEKLKEQVEERLKMFEDVDVMKEALAAVKASQGESEEVPTGTKRKLEEPAVEGSEEPVKKKKKNKKKAAEAEEPSEEAETKTEESVEPETESPKKKKKKKKKAQEEEAIPEPEPESMEVETAETKTPKKKKKKKSKSEEAETVSTEAAEEVATEEASTEDGEKKKKKKKKKKAAESEE